MVWKKVNNSDPGDATHHGGDSTDKISDLFSGVGVDAVDVNSDWKFRSGKHQQSNPANTFKYITVGSAIVADRNVTEPLLTADDTRVYESHIQTVSNKTLATTKIDNFADVKEIAEPASPASGYVRIYTDSTTHKTCVKHSDGSVVVLE